MQRKALIVCVNEYAGITPLRGCVNDGTNLRSILKDVGGFKNDDIRVLMDARATTAAINERLAWLVAGAREGDLLVFHFSGHGSQVRDRGVQDELRDHLDEILCPHDMDWDENFITDDDLTSRLRVGPGVTVEVILDCCNSGDGSLEVGAGPGPVATDDRAPRFVVPPLDVLSRHEGDGLPVHRIFGAEPSHLAMWSACADSQTAADARIQGVFNGAFTFHLCKHLNAAAGALPSRAELLEQVRRSLRSDGFTQIPELAASAELRARVPFALKEDR